ncbi:cysteine-rich motor neuron 1 protein-like isoform X2 [Wyeomyia smithii]|uniref:cysteine-rich motor neuron 1 protein-like isoform X2 n=1 Tax=Wyeomyia smithii TaxID=174621 RepID=UPI002467E3F4|nr:cysteine-rich motor neuron 1 protein-like isoform X2 [Wyeomyia smithii]
MAKVLDYLAALTHRTISSVRVSAKLIVCCLMIMVNSNILALKCVCNPAECDVIRSEDCPGKGFMIWDPCRCCKVCARTIGEACGGPGDFSGTCEPHLSCVSKAPFGGPGICLDLPKRDKEDPEHYPNCTEKVIVQAGCEIVNRKCRCWDTMQLCKTKAINKWEFSNLEECRLNVANLVKSELDFDEDYTVPPRNAASKFAAKKRLLKAEVQTKSSART